MRVLGTCMVLALMGCSEPKGTPISHTIHTPFYLLSFQETQVMDEVLSILVTAHNLSDSTLSFQVTQFDYEDELGTQRPCDPDLSLSGPSLFSLTIPPGQSATGWVSFPLPTGAEPSVVLFDARSKESRYQVIYLNPLPNTQ